MAAGPWRPCLCCGGPCSLGRRPWSERRHRPGGRRWRGRGPAFLAVWMAGAPVDGSPGGSRWRQIWPPLPPPASSAPPRPDLPGSFAGRRILRRGGGGGEDSQTGRNSRLASSVLAAATLVAPFPSLEAPFRSDPSPPIPLVSRVKTSTLLGGGGALGVASFLKAPFLGARWAVGFSAMWWVCSGGSSWSSSFGGEFFSGSSPTGTLRYCSSVRSVPAALPHPCPVRGCWVVLCSLRSFRG